VCNFRRRRNQSLWFVHFPIHFIHLCHQERTSFYSRTTFVAGVFRVLAGLFGYLLKVAQRAAQHFLLNPAGTIKRLQQNISQAQQITPT